MEIHVWKGSWRFSEDLFRKIQEELHRKKVSAGDLRMDPFMVSIANGKRRDLTTIRRKINGLRAQLAKEQE